ncbi:MAG: hypothetical protein HXX11_05065 [Desulfuromonadales bacterium]|nr:hypothetical protein [Desulfuromonadales bacterium]
MSITRGTRGGAFLRRSAVVSTFFAFLVPQAVRAEPLLYLFKEDSGKTTQRNENNRRTVRQSSVLSLNENGELVAKYGSVKLVVGYCPPEEPHKQQEPARLAMAMAQGTQQVSGISIKINFAF